MRISINSGNGELSAGLPPFTVSPSLSLGEFLETEAGREAKKVSSSRYFYSLWQPIGDDYLLGAVLGFHSDAYITSMRLKIGTNKEKEEGIWSKEVEDKIKRRHDVWLKGQIGSIQARFPWGTVSSIIDTHDYSAVVVITYRLIDRNTYYHDQQSAIGRIANAQLTYATIVDGQFTLGIGEDGKLLARVLPDVIEGTVTITSDMADYKERLTSLIGCETRSAELTQKEELIIALREGRALRIPLSKCKGNKERAILSGPKGYQFLF